MQDLLVSFTVIFFRKTPHSHEEYLSFECFIMPRLHEATFIEQHWWIFVEKCWPTKIEPCERHSSTLSTIVHQCCGMFKIVQTCFYFRGRSRTSKCCSSKVASCRDGASGYNLWIIWSWNVLWWLEKFSSQLQCCGITNYTELQSATNWQRTGTFTDQNGNSVTGAPRIV